MNLTDETLYELCQKYGEQARLWRQKFAGLLPEVAKRRLYEKKGFTSIFEFAKKLCGMSEDQVRRVLNLEKSFQDKPILKTMLENGKVSINKLARVASVATTENEEFWAEKVNILPNRALEILVKDEKNIENQSSLDKESVHVHRFEEKLKELNLSNEVVEKLLELQQKGININVIFLEFLAKREQEIREEKEKIAAETEVTPSRYIPVRIKAILQEEYGTKCSMPQCTKPAQTIHHTQRFSLSKTHNPKFLAPLCKSHHIIAHTIDLKFHEKAFRFL